MDRQLADLRVCKPLEDLTGFERLDLGVLSLVDSLNATGSHLSIAPILNSRFLFFRGCRKLRINIFALVRSRSKKPDSGSLMFPDFDFYLPALYHDFNHGKTVYKRS